MNQLPLFSPAERSIDDVDEISRSNTVHLHRMGLHTLPEVLAILEDDPYSLCVGGVTFVGLDILWALKNPPQGGLSAIGPRRGHARCSSSSATSPDPACGHFAAQRRGDLL